MVRNYKNNIDIKNRAGEIIIVVSPALVLLVYKICKIFNIETVCIWKNLFGHKCLGCGMTNAIMEIMKGNFQAAADFNILSFIVFPLILFLWLKYIYIHFIIKR